MMRNNGLLDIYIYIYTFEQNHQEYNPYRYLKTIGLKILYSYISLPRNDLQFSRIFLRRKEKRNYDVGCNIRTHREGITKSGHPRGRIQISEKRVKIVSRFISNNRTRTSRGRIEMRSTGDWNDSRSSHKKRKKERKKKLSFAFLAAIRFKHRTNGSIPLARACPRRLDRIETGILELEGPSIPSTRDEEVSGGYIKRCTESLTWYWIAMRPFLLIPPGRTRSTETKPGKLLTSRSPRLFAAWIPNARTNSDPERSGIRGMKQKLVTHR